MNCRALAILIAKRPTKTVEQLVFYQSGCLYNRPPTEAAYSSFTNPISSVPNKLTVLQAYSKCCAHLRTIHASPD